MVHWDTKLLDDISEKPKKLESLPILVSGVGLEQLLDLPNLANGIGETMVTAVVEALKELTWRTASRPCPFNTTASNTGKQ